MSVAACGAAAQRYQLPGQAKPEQPAIRHPALRQTGQQQPVGHSEEGEDGDQVVSPRGSPRGTTHRPDYSTGKRLTGFGGGNRAPGPSVFAETTGSQYVTSQPKGVPTACGISTTPEEGGAAGGETSVTAVPSGNRQTRIRS